MHLAKMLDHSRSLWGVQHSVRDTHIVTQAYRQLKTTAAVLCWSTLLILGKYLMHHLMSNPLNGYILFLQHGDDFFTKEVNEITKKRLSEKMKIDLNHSFEQVESIYKEEKRMNPEVTGKDFWKLMTKNELGLFSDPKKEIVELILKTQSDLNKISEILSFIDSEIKLNKENKNGGTKERYYKRQLDHYRQQNLKTKERVLLYIEKEIKIHALQRCSEPPVPVKIVGGDYFEMPYGTDYFFYRMLDPRNLTDLSNKFVSLFASHSNEFLEEYENSDSQNKKYMAHLYIKECGVIERIQDTIKKSHIFNRRKTLLEELIDSFNKKNYILCVNILPLQIEGIFADFCRELGTSEEELGISSINAKIEKISEKTHFMFFEYYSFKFPILRNLVAHGELIESDLEEAAINLILDLEPLCYLSENKDLPTNSALEILKKCKADDVDALSDWALLKNKIKINEFYNAEKDIETVEQKYKEDAFWQKIIASIRRTSMYKKDYTKDDLKEIWQETKYYKAVKKLAYDKIAPDLSKKFFISFNEELDKKISDRNALSKIFEEKRKNDQE